MFWQPLFRPPSSLIRLARLSSLLYLISLPNLLWAQSAPNTAETDSILQIIAKTSDPIEKAELYEKLASNLFYNDVEKSMHFVKKGLDCLDQEPRLIRADLYNLMGLLYSAHETDSTIRLGISYMDAAEKIYLEKNNLDGVAKIANNRGGMYRQIFNFDQAIHNFQQNLELSSNTQDTQGIAQAFSSIAGIFLAQKNTDKALEYIKKAYYVTLPRGLKDDLAVYCSNIGRIYSILEMRDSALAYTNLAHAYFEATDNITGQALALEQISNIYRKADELDSAIYYINEALTLAPKIFSPARQLQIRSTLANIYLDQKQYDKSLAQQLKILEDTREIGQKGQELGTLQSLEAIYLALGEHEKAYDYLKKANELETFLLSEEQKERLEDLVVQYETKEKEQKNILLTKERDWERVKANRNKQAMYVIIVVCCLLLISVYFFYQQRQAKAKEQTLQLRHRLLRNQMSPHFIFNALTAIQSFVYKNDARATDKYLSAFSKLMRGILENSRTEYISLEKELQWLENYLKLQSLRFDQQFEYQIVVDPDLDWIETQIPPMLTQPFIENALEHGLKNVDYKGILNIQFKLDHKQLWVIVEDNGIGIDAAAANSSSEHQSLATKITSERLAVLNKYQQEKLYFEISSLEPSGTSVSFKIPLQYEF